MNNFRNLAVWVIIALLLVALFNLFQGSGQRTKTSDMSYSEFLEEVERGGVRSVVIAGEAINGIKSNGQMFQTYAPKDPQLITRLNEKGVEIKARPPADDNLLGSILFSWFPILLMIAVWIFFMRQMQAGSGKAMGFGKSKAKLLTERQGRVTFDDVAGVDEAKDDLQEVVEFLKDPHKFQRLGGKIPKGALLVGPPGTGKTLLARAIAGEANVPFFTISGSDFVEMFVGVGASRVRDMFEQAKKNAPCIIFIDEIDAVGRHRGAGLGGGNDEREQTLNQLLVGPPGTGKTLLARAIAGEAGVPFFTISGSDFVEMFVGVGASRVRDMFEQAKKNAPCIVFIDEIDAVGRSRGVGYGGGNDEREQTLNQLLVEMDGFEANEGIIIVAATNRPDVLDPALLRPGRFDRQVQVPNPDIKGREKILGVHARKVPLGPDVDLRIIARGTPGFSGADLANLVNEAALMAARVGRRFVTMEDFENAKDKVMMGAERRSMVMTEDEKKLTAYHEAGHAIVGLNVPQHDPIHKATIIPRGRALGLVLSLPERDQLSVTYRKYKSKIAMAMGGRAAEEMTFGSENVTSGAASDIQQASRIARAMVTQFGFAEELGMVDYANEQQSHLGPYAAGSTHSEEMQKRIDEKVKEIVDEGYVTAKKTLAEKSEDLERLAQGLLEYETLTGIEITKVIAGEPLNRGDDDEDDTPETGGTASVTAIPKTKPRKKPDAGEGLEPEPEPTS